VEERTARWRTQAGLECVAGFEEEAKKTKAMEHQFKQQVMRLQQQLGLVPQGFVLPS